MQIETITIGGMTCGGCVGSVTRALQRIGGVHDVEVTLAPPRARVAFDPTLVDVARSKTAIEDAGYEIGA